MPLTPDGIWVPSMSLKQFDIFNDMHRIVLVNGPRISGKTTGVLHKIVRHLWETPNGCTGMFAKTVKSAKQRGSFNDLISGILPEWINANIGLRYTTKNNKGVEGPVIDNQTRTSYFRITNIHGGESELLLYSIDYCGDAEAILKSNSYSQIFFSELGNFEDQIVFTASMPQLRIPGLPFESHQWIADCNPTDEGTESWIYKLFYEHRTKKEYDGMDEDEIVRLKEFQESANVIEVHTKDNPFITQKQINEIKNLCHGDPALFERYVNGIWVAGGNLQRHFANAFRPDVHVKGNTNPSNEDEWEYILPTDECQLLLTGFDPGDNNQAIVFLERVEKPDGTLNYYAVLDEVVHIGEEVSVEQLTREILEKMDRLEELAGKKINWRHWSDDQALKAYKSAIGGVTAMQIRNFSNGRIILQGACKERDSVRMRVHMLKRLLQPNKIFFSANCVKTIEAVRELRVHKKDFVQRLHNKFKHAFDALTYALAQETIEELDYTYQPNVGKAGTGLVLMS